MSHPLTDSTDASAAEKILLMESTYALRHQGPLPPPEMLGDYEAVLPGLAKTIVEMALKQSDHRRALEVQVFLERKSRNNRSQWFGLILPLTGTLLAISAAWLLQQDSVLAGLVAVAILLPSWGGPLAAQILARNMRLPSARNEEPSAPHTP
jgi:uncharacterized membrane protein